MDSKDDIDRTSEERDAEDEPAIEESSALEEIALYSQYSLVELREILGRVDPDATPHRHQRILAEIELREEQLRRASRRAAQGPHLSQGCAFTIVILVAVVVVLGVFTFRFSSPPQAEMLQRLEQMRDEWAVAQPLLSEALSVFAEEGYTIRLDDDSREYELWFEQNPTFLAFASTGARTIVIDEGRLRSMAGAIFWLYRNALYHTLVHELVHVIQGRGEADWPSEEESYRDLLEYVASDTETPSWRLLEKRIANEVVASLASDIIFRAKGKLKRRGTEAEIRSRTSELGRSVERVIEAYYQRNFRDVFRHSVLGMDTMAESERAAVRDRLDKLKDSDVIRQLAIDDLRRYQLLQ